MRVWVSIDWSNSPTGLLMGAVKIGNAPGQITVNVIASNPAPEKLPAIHGFVEADGYVAIDAAHYTAKHDTIAAHWERLPDHGRTDSAVSIFPVTAPTANPPQDSPY